MKFEVIGKGFLSIKNHQGKCGKIENGTIHKQQDFPKKDKNLAHKNDKLVYLDFHFPRFSLKAFFPLKSF
jgi:hypothetical protein